MEYTKQKPNHPNSFKDFLLLTKFRLAFSVVFSAIAGYLLAVQKVDPLTLFLLAIGGVLIVGSSNAFNQWMEKDRDALMSRTEHRPLPSGRMTNAKALIIATIMTIIGVGLLCLINLSSALLALLSVFIYTCIYTPLKPRTPLAVFFGAFPGAIPFMLGWIAATNDFGIEAGTLFAIQFFWQFPHFWSIAWLVDDDYKKAGFRLLPTGNRDSGTVFQIVFYTIWMIVISILPATQYTGILQLSVIGAIIIVLMGLTVLYFALKLMSNPTPSMAKPLVRVGIIYISVVQFVFVIDKFVSQ